MIGPGSGEPPRDDDLPEPEIETVRNFSDLPENIRRTFAKGAFLSLDGEAVRGFAIGVDVLSSVLVHFDRLFRILMASKAGLEVARKGRIPEVSGGQRFVALPSVAGSYGVPLRLENPQGELVGEDRDALTALVLLLGQDPSVDWPSLEQYPERVGDELALLLGKLGAASADLKVEAVRDGASRFTTEISASTARARGAALTERVESEVGREVVRGKLFRIDTKRGRIAIDAQSSEDEDGDDDSIVRITFKPSQLEALREALDHQVEVEVEVLEERRPYERTARTRLMHVTEVRLLSDGPALDEAAESPDDDPEAEP